MSNTDKAPVFNELTQALTHISGLISASEAHGILCGFICVGNFSGSKQWIESIVDNQHAMQKNRELLSSIFETSRTQLQTNSHDFQLLLPDNKQSLTDQAYGLSCWCQGFLSGLNFAGVKKDILPEELQDILAHFFDISELNYREIEIQKTDIRALTEAIKYVRNSIFKVHHILAQNSFSLH
ncbi:UPF0149 family protein [soil metagenome]